MLYESYRSYPLETGGLLLGSLSGQDELVVTTIVGPGRNAIHRPWSFDPDQDWHERALAKVYADSGRKVQYLGDWHSHPNGRASLSPHDKDALKLIASFAPARNSEPIMLVIACSDDGTVQSACFRLLGERMVRLRLRLCSLPCGAVVDL